MCLCLLVIAGMIASPDRLKIREQEQRHKRLLVHSLEWLVRSPKISSTRFTMHGESLLAQIANCVDLSHATVLQSWFYANHAIVAERQGEVTNARALWRLAAQLFRQAFEPIYLSPGPAGTYFQLLIRAGQFPRARQELRAYLSHHPSEPRSWLLYADVHRFLVEELFTRTSSVDLTTSRIASLASILSPTLTQPNEDDLLKWTEAAMDAIDIAILKSPADANLYLERARLRYLRHQVKTRNDRSLLMRAYHETLDELPQTMHGRYWGTITLSTWQAIADDLDRATDKSQGSIEILCQAIVQELEIIAAEFSVHWTEIGFSNLPSEMTRRIVRKRAQLSRTKLDPQSDIYPQQIELLYLLRAQFGEFETKQVGVGQRVQTANQYVFISTAVWLRETQSSASHPTSEDRRTTVNHVANRSMICSAMYAGKWHRAERLLRENADDPSNVFDRIAPLVLTALRGKRCEASLALDQFDKSRCELSATSSHRPSIVPLRVIEAILLLRMKENVEATRLAERLWRAYPKHPLVCELHEILEADRPVP